MTLHGNSSMAQNPRAANRPLLFIGPLVRAFLAVTLLTASACRREPQMIVFDSKFFSDNEAVVGISGTLTGDGLPYQKNNSVVLTCYKERMECLSFYAEQIGPNQVGALGGPTRYPVIKWDAYEIVATDDGPTINCSKLTISIERKSATSVWVQEPTNQSSARCKNAETRVLKWTIEDPAWWHPKARR